MKNLTPEQQLIQDLASLSNDPYKFVMYAFPWGEAELQGFKGPEAWQKEVLDYISQQLKTNPYRPIRIAVSAGNGPGKSALACWLILWALSTFEDTRGVVTANTETQLRTKTWAELAKWHRLFIAKNWFELTATAIYSKDKNHERTWRIDQVPWSEHNAEAFAGLHNKGKRILVIYDEASAIADIIWDTTEGALTDENTQILWLVFGNPTRNSGRFFECFHAKRNRWKTWQIDIRKSSLVNQEEVKSWIEEMGLDSDWVKVHILGQFPSASDLQFIPRTLAEQARARAVNINQYAFAPKVIGVDTAWTGGDKTVIVLRQGLIAKILQVFSKNDDDSIIAGAIAKWEDQEQVDAVFIDYSYGTGIYSFGKQLNRNWTLVNFGARSNTSGYANKRAEMWGLMKKWLQEGGSIPDDQELIDDLTGPEAVVKLNGEILLEPKEKMRRRGLASPNKADALALTFAYPVFKKQRHNQTSYEPYDPFKETPERKKEYNPLE